MRLESIINSWLNYRRALRDRDREIFDEIANKARRHSSAASFCAHLDPVECAMLSILLEIQKEILKIKGEK